MIVDISMRASRVILLIGIFTIALGLWGNEIRAAEEERPTANISVDFLSQYIWRGYAFSRDSVVIQPSFTASYKGFSINVWGNLDTHEATELAASTDTASWNETDLTLSYTRTLFGNLSGTVGYIYYGTEHFLETMEGYVGLSYALPWFTVGVTGYREFWHVPAWWMQIDISRNFKLPWYDMSVDTGFSVGYLDVSNTEYAEFHAGQIAAALNIPIGKYLTISPKIGLAFPLTDAAADNIKAGSVDQEDTHVFGGLRITAAF